MTQTESDLFPSAWPVGAWPWFAEQLPPLLYGKSNDLWLVIQRKCKDVNGWLSHWDYEGQIDRSGTFSAATKHIPDWMTIEETLRQVRNTIGKDTWDRLVSTAEERRIPAERLSFGVPVSERK